MAVPKLAMLHSPRPHDLEFALHTAGTCRVYPTRSWGSFGAWAYRKLLVLHSVLTLTKGNGGAGGRGLFSSRFYSGARRSSEEGHHRSIPWIRVLFPSRCHQPNGKRALERDKQHGMSGKRAICRDSLSWQFCLKTTELDEKEL